jgi:DNA invertase Pin-like site-specific DNA recombinase
MKEKLRPAVGYIRMSTDQQQDSPARQRQDIEALAGRQGFRIIRWYEDHGQTGTESSKRREFQKLLGDAKAGTFQAVLLSEQSRMSREDIFDAMQHWRKFRDAGVSIITCQRGELKFDNLGGVITAIVDQYGAREESIRLADRVVSGKRLALSRGQRQAGGLLGYDREILDETGQVVRRVPCGQKFIKPHHWSSRLVPAADLKRVETVRLMFQWVGEGWSYSRVAKELNRRGYRTLYGNRFNGNKVRLTISNPSYQGDIVVGRFKPRGKFRTLQGEAVGCENAHEGLVSRELFARVQQIIRKRRGGPRSTRPGQYLLTGLVYLADRNWRLQGKRGKRHPYYTVNARVTQEHPEVAEFPSFRADIIEQGVLAKLRAYLADERNQRVIQSELTKRSRKAKSNVAGLEKTLAAIRAKIERGTENLALAEPADVPGISRLLGQWREDEAKILEQLQEAHGERAPSPEVLEIMTRLDGLLDRISDADRDKLAYAIRQTVKRITLRRTLIGNGRACVWDGAIELCDGLGVSATIPLTDEDIPSPGLFRDVVRFLRERGQPALVREIGEHLGCHRTNLVRPLKIAVQLGKIRRAGLRQGYEAIPATKRG